jgi:hypothetical protein
VTNVTFLRKLLESDELRTGRYDTQFAEAFAKRG